MKKQGYLALGLAIGLMAGSCASAFAAGGIQEVNAYINSAFNMTVDGQATTLADGYTMLVYQDRTYVPVRAIGELVGANVDWDDANKTVIIEKAKAQETPVTPQNPDVINGSESGVAGVDYKALPQTYETTDFRVSATAYSEDKTYGNRLYFNVKNKQDKVLRLNQGSTKYIINDKEYSFMDTMREFADQRWYTRYVSEDEELEGYLRLPDPDNFDETVDTFTVHIELQYDGDPKVYPIEFNIKQTPVSDKKTNEE